MIVNFSMAIGFFIALEGALIIFYSYRTLKNILRDPEVALRMFVLEEKASRSFKVLAKFLMIYGFLGSILATLAMVRPGLIPQIALEYGPIILPAISLIGLIYFLKTISEVTSGNQT